MSEFSRPTIYLDSMVFIYAVEGDRTTGPSARKLIAELQNHMSETLTSELSLAEVLAPTKKRGKIPVDLRETYLELMVTGKWLTLEPLTRAILLETAELRSRAVMRLPDSIHVATAFLAGCRCVVTNDSNMSLPIGMVKIQPDDTSVAVIRTMLR